MLLRAHYYESSNIENITYDTYGDMLSSSITSVESDSDYGWYVINSVAENLVKQISMDVSVDYEQ